MNGRWMLLLSILQVACAAAAEPGPFPPPAAKDAARAGREAPVLEFQRFDAHGHTRAIDLRFAHLTTRDGLSQGNITEILQDRKGFIWFATRDGLNRYDGYTFMVYKNNPNDTATLSANYITDLQEDDRGYLWIATDFGGVNRFDAAAERFIRYRHDPNNANSLAGDSVESIARDSRGALWFGTADNGLDKLDPASSVFTHYRNDTSRQRQGYRF